MIKRDRLTLSTLALAVVLTLAGHLSRCLAADPHARWERDIQAFEASDKTNPPPSDAILFVGSSSIRMWKTLAEDFPGVPVINRGYGGSEMEDTLFFADRIVLPYRPKQIFVYAGDNDVAAGKSPERIAKDFEAFVKKVHHSLPEARIAYISIKPSGARLKLMPIMREANRLIAEYAATDQRLAFVDVFNPMLNQDGEPKEELFLDDKLHLNKKGYELWTSLVRPHIAE